ncbi:hypothetical protein BP5796_02766 [Coleophoma crateriformis]|uniref:CHL4-domain-containing protein n=1 Tax=Coleophoma crateriformis TaxID=565419 RepID=A0A3D8SZK5_9HELO|nr:hypothetical protein BP5796_02766 [Coleophoma crateriformis]
MPSLSVPTTSALPANHRIPATSPSVFKALQRLARPSLISVVLHWLHDDVQEICPPYLRPESDEEDEQDLYPACSNLKRLRELYRLMQERNGGKREVVDRVLEGDWRHGITLYQLALIDMQYLYDHPTSQKWTALKIIRLSSDDVEDGDRPKEQKSMTLPRLHPATFLQNLRKEAPPDVKAYYNIDRHGRLPLTILRMFIMESPYNTERVFSASSRATLDSSKHFYVAFPDNSPYVYVSLTTSTGAKTPRGSRSIRQTILEGIPKAFSRPRERYGLESTNLSAKNLEALVERRGGLRTNAAGGGWGVYADGNKNDTPLNHSLSADGDNSGESETDVEPRTFGLKRKPDEVRAIVKRRKLLAKGRFGNSGLIDDGKGIEQFDVRIQDPFFSDRAASPVQDEHRSSDQAEKGSKGRRSTIDQALAHEAMDLDEDEDTAWRPEVTVSFHGSHVFAGIRQWVESGAIKAEKMPGWMTGEEGVSIGVVRDGRIKGFKGSRV